MDKIIKGRSFIFKNNVDTDQIYPGRYLELVEPKEIIKHCLEGADKNFSNDVKSGDILIAGTNFGCGSSREHAAIALKSSGIAIVIAESFARIFYRNSTNLALPLMICKGISTFADREDIIEVNLESGVIKNLTHETVIQGEKISEHIYKILNAGGIKPLFINK